MFNNKISFPSTVNHPFFCSFLGPFHNSGGTSIPHLHMDANKYFAILNNSFYSEICIYVGIDVICLKHDTDSLTWWLNRH